MSEGLVQTKSSLSRQGKVPEFQEVVFTSYKRNESSKPSAPPVGKKRGIPDPIPKSEADEQRKFMKKARHDIIKFGMTGFDAAKKQQTKEALAVSLGAKPRKGKSINYKELKEMRAKQKEEEKSSLAFQNLGKTASGHASAKIKNRMRRNKEKPRGDHKGGLLGVYGKVRKTDVPKK